MTTLDDFIRAAVVAGDVAQQVTAEDITGITGEQMDGLLDAIRRAAGGAAHILGQLQNDALVASGEVPPVEELTRLLIQSSHRAHVTRNRRHYRT
jgi:hypothetical protein